MKPTQALLSLALSFLAWVLFYTVLRLAAAVGWQEPDPALVVWSTRNAYGWRLLLASYGALAVWPLAYRWVQQPLGSKTGRWLQLAIMVVALVVTAQLILVP